MRPNARTAALAAVASWVAAVWTAGCHEPLDSLRERFRAASRHEEYEALLRRAGLDGTALGSDWIEAGRAALRDPVPASTPFRAVGFFPPEEPGAAGYRFRLEDGQAVEAEVRLDGGERVRLFIDLFRIPSDTTRAPRLLAEADTARPVVRHEARRDGRYLLRVQPELLRGGRYTVTIVVRPTLAFPVPEHDVEAILSRFGAPRDGGRREHHGVDIFAPRGTPVVAAADGVVRRAGTGGRGGNVVWLRDREREQSLYYAHLDRHAVRTGDRVRAGDTIGFVGNTGNARTTPPHLHFGIYRRGRGPVDPFAHIRPLPVAPAELAVAVDRIGGWARATAPRVPLRAAPHRDARLVAELDVRTPLRVLGGSARWYRVALPDGRRGFVAGGLTEVADPPERLVYTRGPVPVGEAPMRPGPESSSRREVQR